MKFLEKIRHGKSELYSLYIKEFYQKDLFEFIGDEKWIAFMKNEKPEHFIFALIIFFTSTFLRFFIYTLPRLSIIQL